MKKKNKRTTLLLLLLFFVGLSVLLYPSVSDYWNTRTQSKTIIDYEATMAHTPKADYTAQLDAAERYNDALYGLAFPLLEYASLTDYDQILDVNGNGMMGYVTIRKIGVELPLYHGTSDAVLGTAIGHLEGSSFPVGGESTHAVLSAHRGLPSARLFTELDKLEIGDTFTVTVLDRVCTYEVDQIRIVQPDQVDELRIVPGADYCTLLTCTPYGINTERLLVRGVRVEHQQQTVIRITSDGYRVEPLVVTPVVALPMLVILMLVVLLKPAKKTRWEEELE